MTPDANRRGMRGYTGSRSSVRRERRLARILIAAVTTSVVAVGAVLPVDKRVLEGISEQYRGKIFLLEVDLHAPAPGSLYAPMYDKNGWHFRDPSTPIVLERGRRVEITGAFNYSERGFFLEFAEESDGFFERPIERRARIRIRFMVESLPDAPDEQASQADDLVARLIQPVSVP